MGKDFEELVIKRCEEALMENEEYIKLETSDCENTQEEAEVLCYKKGFRDAFKIVAKICSQ